MNDENTHPGATTDSVRVRAEKLLQERLHAISGLEDAVAAVEAAKASLQAAEKRMTDAISIATAAGWSTTELSQLGIPVSTPSRRAKASTTRKGKRGGGGPEQAAG